MTKPAPPATEFEPEFIAAIVQRTGCALLLDCRSRRYDHLPFAPATATVVVIDTQVKHEIGGGEYAARQRQCRAGVEFFRKIDPGVRALRDVSEELLNSHIRELEKVTAARCRHVVTENRRVVHAAEALRAGAFHEFGQLMTESHRSLRDDYQVSCEELDTVVEIACGIGGVYGARMTGGGFGGCAIALAEEDAVEPLRRAIKEKYDRRFSKPAIVYTTHAAAGADVVEVPDVSQTNRCQRRPHRTGPARERARGSLRRFGAPTPAAKHRRFGLPGRR